MMGVTVEDIDYWKPASSVEIADFQKLGLSLSQTSQETK